MSEPSPTRPIEVQLGDVAESIHTAFNRATHDSWQEGYLQAQTDAANEHNTTVTALKPSDYTIRLAALDRALSRGAALDRATDVITNARRFESYLRGNATTDE